MITDLHALDADTIDADICIIGTGAAGMMLALELQHSPLKIVLLEGGKLSSDARTQKLYDLECDALFVATDSRRRLFGGTTTAWTGGWKPLDECDFEERSWIPFSGWPMRKTDLELYYDRAAAYISGLSVEEFAAHVVKQKAEKHLAPLFQAGAIDPTFLWTLPKENWNFGKKFHQLLARSASLHILLNANVTKLNACDANDEVTSLTIQTLRGKRCRLTAKKVIVACGGIENARLLLHSNIGNVHDQVGRYYMDHPKGSVGRIRSNDYAPLSPLFDSKNEQLGTMVSGLQLSAAVQETARTTNSYVQLRPVYRDRGFFHRLFLKLLGRERPVKELQVRNFMEQVPSPDNRVTLSSKMDAFGNPLAMIHWSIEKRDKDGVCILHKTLQKELQKSGLGELTSPLADEETEPWPIVDDASHHMGTTRMGNDPQTSVVDADCRVHGVKNLFIAGSSVFPTGGHANPTATIMALAVRLADHVKKET